MVDENKKDTVSESEEKKIEKEATPTEKPAEEKEIKKEEVEVKKEIKKEEKKEEVVVPVTTVAEESTAGEEVEVPKKFQQLVEQVETMSVLELHELVKLLEKKFGVSAAAVAVAGPAGDDDGVEEKTEFTVELVSDGGAKIPTMKVVKEILGLGLKEAKDLVEGVPSVLKEGVKKEDAEEMKKKLEAAGATVEIK